MSHEHRPYATIIQREPRCPYHGRLRVMVVFDPWRLLITLKAINLSSSGVLGVVVAATTAREAEQLLAEGDPYQLQLEHDSEHLPAPLVTARLVRRQHTNAGLELAFAFEAPDIGLLSLLHELSASR